MNDTDLGTCVLIVGVSLVFFMAYGACVATGCCSVWYANMRKCVIFVLIREKVYPDARQAPIMHLFSCVGGPMMAQVCTV